MPFTYIINAQLMKSKVAMVLEQAQRRADLINSAPKHPSIKAVEELHQQTIARCREAGKEDGQRSIPSFESEYSDFESQVAAEYQGEFIRRTAQERGLLAQLESRYQNLRDDFAHTEAGRTWAEIQEIEQRFNKERVANRRTSGETDASRFLLRYGRSFLAAYLIFSLCELPLTAETLKALKMNPGQAMVLGSAVTIGVALLAHLSGKQMKQWKHSVKSRLFAFSIGGVLLTYTLVLGLFRAAVSITDDSFAQPTGGIFNGNPADYLQGLSFHDIVQSKEFMVTIALIIILVAVGIAVGFASHDSSPGFEAAFADYHFQRPEKLRRFAIQRSQSAREAEALHIQDNVGQQVDEMKHLQELMHTLRSYLNDFANYADAMCRAAISTYRNHNRQERNNPEEIPLYWNYAPERYIEPVEKKVPEIQLPD